MITHSRLVNLTPHPVHVETSSGREVEIPITLGQERPRVAGDKTVESLVYIPDGSALLPVYVINERQVTGLPPEEEGTLYIVSSLVAEATPLRADLVCPFGRVYDSKGRVIGCKGFLRPSPIGIRTAMALVNTRYGPFEEFKGWVA